MSNPEGTTTPEAQSETKTFSGEALAEELEAIQGKPEAGQPKVESETAPNPYERFSDEQLQTIRGNLIDSVAQSITNSDEFDRSSQNLLNVVRETRRRVPEDQRPEEPVDTESTIYPTQLDVADIDAIAQKIIASGSANAVDVGYAWSNGEHAVRISPNREDKEWRKEELAKVNIAKKVMMQMIRLKAPGYDDYRLGEYKDLVDLEEKEAKSKEKLPFRASSFEEAEKISRGFSEDFVMNLLNEVLTNPEGEATVLKVFLDKVPATQDDYEAAQKPGTLADIHSQIRAMIADNLKIAVSGELGRGERKLLVDARTRYQQELRDGDPDGREFFSKVAAGAHARGQDIQFEGLPIPIPGEPRPINILSTDGKVRGVRPNIRFQEEVSGQFIHWSSDSYAKAKAEGRNQNTEMTKRIYLNPRPEDSVKVFSALMKAANESGLTVHGKMLDRAMELCQDTQRAARGEKISLRADGIVLYASDAEADKILELVKALPEDLQEAFVGRPSPKIPTQIAEGIALGSEPTTDAPESLTSHRTKALEEAGSRTLQRLGLAEGQKVPPQLKVQAHRIFLAEFKKLAPDYDINPDNFSFNLN